MPLTRMEHFLVLADDIDATRDFYRDVLGLEEGPRPPLGFPGYWMYLGDVPCVHIAEWKTYTTHSNGLGIPVSSRARGTGPFDHIAFTANDYEEMRARLERHGVRAAANCVHGSGLRQLFLEDPNGVKIEINFPPRPAQ